MQQKIAFRILKNGQNVFLTGSAGAGKTYVLNKYIHYLKHNNINHGITASTGIAATHICGRTIHAWSGLGILHRVTKKDIKKILKNPIIKYRIKKAKVLIIDEISMMHADQIDSINEIVRFAKQSWEPFGGMQIVLCGDFFQLPPVKEQQEKEIKFAFESQSWKELDLQVCYLSEQFRHNDDDITHILNNMRRNIDVDHTKKILNNACINIDDNHLFYEDDIIYEDSENFEFKKNITKLYTHNKDVDRINNTELSHLKSKIYTYEMVSDGNEFILDAFKKNCLAPELLQLKKGAFVMFVRNNFDVGYVNGTTGIVTGFTSENDPIVTTIQNKKITVFSEEWKIEENGEIIASISQLPLRLAWAITVHKSQGMTLDSIETDLRYCFEYGMGYVALSRVRSLKDIILYGFNKIALQVDPKVIKQDKKFQRQSQLIEKNMK